MKRRCGWLPSTLNSPERVVWARGQVSTTTCPKSFITAQSLAWLEAFHGWRSLGLQITDRLEARKADAFLVLSEELAAERRNRQLETL